MPQETKTAIEQSTCPVCGNLQTEIGHREISLVPFKRCLSCGYDEEKTTTRTYKGKELTVAGLPDIQARVINPLLVDFRYWATLQKIREITEQTYTEKDRTYTALSQIHTLCMKALAP